MQPGSAAVRRQAGRPVLPGRPGQPGLRPPSGRQRTVPPVQARFRRCRRRGFRQPPTRFAGRPTLKRQLRRVPGRRPARVPARQPAHGSGLSVLERQLPELKPPQGLQPGRRRQHRHYQRYRHYQRCRRYRRCRPEGPWMRPPNPPQHWPSPKPAAARFRAAGQYRQRRTLPSPGPMTAGTRQLRPGPQGLEGPHPAGRRPEGRHQAGWPPGEQRQGGRRQDGPLPGRRRAALEHHGPRLPQRQSRPARMRWPALHRRRSCPLPRFRRPWRRRLRNLRRQ